MDFLYSCWFLQYSLALLPTDNSEAYNINVDTPQRTFGLYHGGHHIKDKAEETH